MFRVYTPYVKDPWRKETHVVHEESNYMNIVNFILINKWQISHYVRFMAEYWIPSRELNISHLGTRKIINSKVTAGRGYVIVPRRVTGLRMTYIFPIWLWFSFPASGASVSTPMDRKTSEMSCATRDESHHCWAHVVQMEIQQRKCQRMVSAKKQGIHWCFMLFWENLKFPKPHTSWCPYMNLT